MPFFFLVVEGFASFNQSCWVLILIKKKEEEKKVVDFCFVCFCTSHLQYNSIDYKLRSNTLFIMIIRVLVFFSKIEVFKIKKKKKKLNVIDYYAFIL